MKFRIATQTAEATESSWFSRCSMLPVKWSALLLGENLTIRTMGVRTRITPDACVEFRYYKWWSWCQYRVIVRRANGYRAIDFRGVGMMRDPAFFESLGYKVTRVDKFWRRSSDESDEKKYGFKFTAPE